LTEPTQKTAPGWAQRLALDGRPQRAWALYDWANSAYITIVVTAVFPVYFSAVAAGGLKPETATQRFAMATTLALLIIAMLAPFLGNLANRKPWKKRLLALFMAIGAGATACMALIGPGDWQLALVLFVIGNVGAYGSFIFYDALLPHLAQGEKLDRLSTSGYALGYLGGGLLLLLNLGFITVPEFFGLGDAGSGTKLAFLTVAIWWVGFSIPLLKNVPEPPVVTPLDAGKNSALATFKDLLGHRDAALFLLAFLIYNDGIVTIIRMATLYGTELGIDQGLLIAAIVMVQFVGIPFALLFGRAAGRVGVRKALLFTLLVYCVIAGVGYLMTNAVHFFLLAFLVATVQGGCQALSRSLFASMIPAHESARFFAFYAVTEKCAAVLGPATFAIAIALTGSSRVAVLVIGLFFIIGAQLLMRVDVDRGRADAARATADAAKQSHRPGPVS
jgi:UMF1 family MFS transporter